MYFWKSDKLFDDLNNGVVTERDKILYYLLSMVLISGAMWLVDWEPTPLKFGDHAYYFVTSIAFPLSVLYSFKKYRPETFFLERYVCLSFPLVLKMMLFATFISFVIEMLVMFYPGMLFLSQGMAVTLPVVFWFYIKLYRYMIRF